MNEADQIHAAVEALEAAGSAHAAADQRLTDARAQYLDTLATLRAKQREFDNLVAQVNARHAVAGSLWSIDPPKTT